MPFHDHFCVIKVSTLECRGTMDLGDLPGSGRAVLWQEGRPALRDQFDVTLEDDELMAEVELTTSLIIAATASDGPLSQAEIDAILGVEPTSATPATEATPPVAPAPRKPAPGA